MHGDEVPLFFYSDLFIKHPEVRDLFPVSMAAPLRHLVDALVKIVSQVDSVTELTAFLGGTGPRSPEVRAAAEHYDAAGASLLATIEHFSGPAWTPDLAADWKTAYELIGSIMIAFSARRREPAAPLVARDGGGPRAAGVRCLRAVRQAGAADGLPAWAVRGDRVSEPPQAVALLLHGERALVTTGFWSSTSG